MSYYASGGSFTLFAGKHYIVFYSTEIYRLLRHVLINKHVNWFLFFLLLQIMIQGMFWYMLLSPHTIVSLARDWKEEFWGQKAFIFNILIGTNQLPSWSSEPRLGYGRGL